MAEGLTVHSQIPQSRTRRPLYFGIMAAQEEQDRIQRIPSYLPDLLFRNLRKRQSGGTLEVDIVAKREGGEGGERGSGEKVGRRPVCHGNCRSDQSLPWSRYGDLQARGTYSQGGATAR